MRVTFVYHAGLRYVGHKYLAEKITGLQRLGIECQMVAPHEGEQRFPDGSTPQYELVPIRFERGWCARSVKRAVNRFDPDIIHVWNPRSMLSRVALELMVGTGARLVVNYEDPEHFHFDAVTGPFKEAHRLGSLDQAFPTAADVEAFVSQLNWHWILETLPHPSSSDFLHPVFFALVNQLAAGFTGIWTPWVKLLSQRFRKPTELAPHAVDLDRWTLPATSPEDRSAFGLGAEDFILLRAGVVYHGLHDIENMLAGFADLVKSRPHCRLVLTGFDHQQEHTASLIRRLGVEKQVLRLNVLGDEDYRRILALADVGLCPGYPDDYNRYRLAGKIVEYMLAGKPMICYATGIGEDLTHGENALLLDEYTPERMCEHMLALADDSDLRRRLGAAARKQAEQWFDVRTAAKTLSAFYEQLVANPVQTPPTTISAGIPRLDALQQAWSKAAAHMEASGIRQIAIYGAGQHTRRLLERHRVEPFQIQCIVDDHPSSAMLCGIPVVTPAEIERFDLDALVLSSDSIESLLLRRAHQWLPEHIPVISLYGAQ